MTTPVDPESNKTATPDSATPDSAAPAAAGPCSAAPDSTGKPECDKVLHDVWLFLDNELDPNARAAVQQHLDDCSPCLDEAGLDEKLKRLVHRGCSGEQAPRQLRTRVLAALQERVRVTRVDPATGTVSTVDVQTTQISVRRTGR